MADILRTNRWGTVVYAEILGAEYALLVEGEASEWKRGDGFICLVPHKYAEYYDAELRDVVSVMRKKFPGSQHEMAWVIEKEMRDVYRKRR